MNEEYYKILKLYLKNIKTKSKQNIWRFVFVLFVFYNISKGIFFKISFFIKAVLIINFALLVKTAYQMIRSACKTTSTKIGNHGVVAR